MRGRLIAAVLGIAACMVGLEVWDALEAWGRLRAAARVGLSRAASSAARNAAERLATERGRTAALPAAPRVAREAREAAWSARQVASTILSLHSAANETGGAADQALSAEVEQRCAALNEHVVTFLSGLKAA